MRRILDIGPVYCVSVQYFPDRIGSSAGRFALVQADSTDGGFASKFTTSAGYFAQCKAEVQANSLTYSGLS